MKGFRQQPAGNRKEKLRSMETETKNTAMAIRINQMMTQQLMQNLKGMHEDIGRALNLISELQYKILAVQKVAGLDVEAMNAIANEQRLADFTEASDKEDLDKGFVPGETVNSQSTVILTSTTDEGADKGIFRSRIKLSECGVPDLIAAFMDREVGAKAIVSLNGLDHTVELLAIRQPTISEVEETESDVSESDGEDSPSLSSNEVENQATA